jgi:hypothetical protein
MRSFVLTFLLLPVVACTNFLDLGGNDPDPAPSKPGAADGKKDATSTTPTQPAALTTYCAARSDWSKTCSMLAGCEQERSAQCSDVFSVYRDEYLGALTTCGFPSECTSSITTDAIDTCVVEAKDKIAPTDAQQKLASDLCAVCPNPGGGDCLDGFFNHGRRNPDGSYTVGGQGSSFDMFEESVVAKIRTACLPDVKAAGGSSCWPALYSCIDQQIAAVEPASVATACEVDGPTMPPGQ